MAKHGMHKKKDSRMSATLTRGEAVRGTKGAKGNGGAKTVKNDDNILKSLRRSLGLGRKLPQIK